MHLLKSSIVAFVLFMACSQADPVPPGAQDSQGGATTTTGGQGNSRPPNPELEECEKDCEKTWASIGKQRECKDECLWTYAKSPQGADDPAQGQPNPTRQECEEDCMKKWGSASKQNECKDECLWTYGR